MEACYSELVLVSLFFREQIFLPEQLQEDKRKNKQNFLKNFGFSMKWKILPYFYGPLTENMYFMQTFFFSGAIFRFLLSQCLFSEKHIKALWNLFKKLFILFSGIIDQGSNSLKEGPQGLPRGPRGQSRGLLQGRPGPRGPLQKNRDYPRVHSRRL